MAAPYTAELCAGAGIAPASGWGAIPDYLAKADAQVCLLLQVETKRGLEKLDEIGATAGVDGIFLGAADLSASLGYLGQPSYPVVIEAMSDASQARAFIDQGCLFVAVGVDTLLLAQATRALAAAFDRRSVVGADDAAY